MLINRFITITLMSAFFFALFEKEGIANYPILSGIFFISVVIWSFSLKSFPKKYFNPIKFLAYFLWLAKEIVISSWQVTKIIWSLHLKISPHIEEINTQFAADSAELIVFANSITLTPGTFTIDISESKLLIHALVEGSLEDFKSNKILEKKVKQYFVSNS